MRLRLVGVLRWRELATVNQPIYQPVINPRRSRGGPQFRDPLQALPRNRSEPESRLTDLNRWPSLYNDSRFEIHCAAVDLGCTVDFLINCLINLLLNRQRLAYFLENSAPGKLAQRQQEVRVFALALPPVSPGEGLLGPPLQPG